jgi:hypothetical protein
MLIVACATKGDREPSGLEYIPVPYQYLPDTRKGWAAASNALLNDAAWLGADVLFVDDDVSLTPRTFEDFERWYDLADVIGFRLTQGGRTVSAGHVLYPDGLLLPNQYPDEPAYLAHVTASAMYIKHRVLRAGVRFPEWPGVHSEDVAFTHDVWMHGFQVLYWPSPVEHALEPSGIGATKAHETNLPDRLQANAQRLHEWCAARDMSRVLRGRQPLVGVEA